MLNEYQEKAIERALSSERVFLIHGPPGTGKTTTLVELIKRLVRRGEKVLATEYYAEIEKLKGEQERYLKPVPRYRRGLTDEEILKRAATGTPVRGLSPKVLRSMAKWIRIQERIRSLYEKAQREESKAVERILKRAEVVCTTNSTAGSEILKEYSFDTIVIDEATQAVEGVELHAVRETDRPVRGGNLRNLTYSIQNEQKDNGISEQSVLRGKARSPRKRGKPHDSRPHKGRGIRETKGDGQGNRKPRKRAGVSERRRKGVSKKGKYFLLQRGGG